MHSLLTFLGRPQTQTLASALDDIARFVGVKVKSQEMATLTRMSTSTLQRVMVPGDPPSVREFPHVAVLAEYVWTMRELLALEAAGRPIDHVAIRFWLHAGCVKTELGPMIPFDALSDPAMARAELAQARLELEEARGRVA